MSNDILSIDYYKKDKEMRDTVQSLHEILDTRYKETSSVLKTLFEAQVAGQQQVTVNHEHDEDENQTGSTTMLHVAEVHQEDPVYIDNPGFAIDPEDISFGPNHNVVMDKIKDSIKQLFGTNFNPKDASEEKTCLTPATEKKSLTTAAKGNGISPHLCTVAWNKGPKRYQECIALVRTVDNDNKPLSKGGAEVKGVFSWSRYDKQFCKVIDNDDGTYRLIYSANCVRFHLLFITVNGCDVAGSPFIVDVEDDDTWGE